MDHPTRRFNTPDEPPPDHPTRRLGSLPGSPIDRSCLRCGTLMVEAWVSASHKSLSPQVFLYHPFPILSTAPLPTPTPCTAWACPACGTTEFVAAFPSVLLPDLP